MEQVAAINCRRLYFSGTEYQHLHQHLHHFEISLSLSRHLKVVEDFYTNGQWKCSEQALCFNAFFSFFFVQCKQGRLL